jgi:hypothetical protein
MEVWKYGSMKGCKDGMMEDWKMEMGNGKWKDGM